MITSTSKWWDINKILSYNKLLNFVVGLRGGGKTYGSKKKVIQNFIRKHKQFVYIRRYKSEMRLQMGISLEQLEQSLIP